MIGPLRDRIEKTRTARGSSAEADRGGNGKGSSGQDDGGEGVHGTGARSRRSRSSGGGMNGGAGGSDGSSGSGGGGGDSGGRGRRDGGSSGSGPGDPDCPRCGGLGWLRRDVEVGHPEFGRAVACECIADDLARQRLSRVKEASNITALDEMRFERFRTDAPGNSADAVRTLETAYRVARAFAEDPTGWLVLHGGYGSGKTHLAAAVVNARLAQGSPALFVVVPDLLDHLRGAFAPGSESSYDERFEAVKSAPLLVLDDLGTQAPTAWAAEKLFQLLNHRYTHRLPTVITTNHPPEALDDRLRSRLGHFDVVRVIEMNALDYRGGLSPDDITISSLHHYADMTFNTWDGRVGELRRETAENLHRAFGTAREFSDEPMGWLVLLGDHGSGKTHLAAAIANARIAAGGAALFVVVPDLLDHLRATFSPSSRVAYDKRFEEVRSTPLLVLDDLGTESATPWAREKLYQILNHRYAARLPTVITTAGTLSDVDPRLRARMLDSRRCLVFEILAPPFNGLVGGGGSGGGSGGVGSASGTGRSGRSGSARVGGSARTRRSGSAPGVGR